MLLAEDLLLLLTDDGTGRLTTSAAYTDIALGGALLVELTLNQRVDLAGSGERVRRGRLIVRDPSPTGDRLLDEALAAVGRREGKRPQGVVPALGKGARKRIYQRLVDGGLLRAEEGRVLGLFPRRRWPAADTGHKADVRAGLVTSLQRGAATDARAGALVSLLLALKVVPKVVEPESVGLSRRELNRSAKRIAEGDWAGPAVRSAIDSMNAAITVVLAAGAATVVSGGN